MKLRIKQIMFTIFFLFLHTTLCGAAILGVPEISQEQTNWCWAGCSQATLSSYGVSVSQCTIANFARSQNGWGSSDCCVNPEGSVCNQAIYMYGTAGSFQAILENWGVDSNAMTYALSQSTISSEINSGRPFEIRWGWTTGGGHFLVGRGIEGDLIYYMDPWPGNGYQAASYDWVVHGSNHDWTHSLQITTNPGLVFSNWSYPATVEHDETIPVEVDITNAVGVKSAEIHYDYGNDGSEDGTVSMNLFHLNGIEAMVHNEGGAFGSGAEGDYASVNLNLDSQNQMHYNDNSESTIQLVTPPEAVLVVSGGKGGYWDEEKSNIGGYSSFKVRMGTGYDSNWNITGERYVFSGSDGVYLGLEYLNVYPEDTPKSVGDGWYRPDGSTYYENKYRHTLPNPQDYNYDYWLWYRFVYYYDPMPDSMKMLEGNWNARSYDDGNVSGSNLFTISYNLADYKIAADVQDSYPWNPTDVRDRFISDDVKVCSWLQLGNLTYGTYIKWEWYDPSDSKYGEYEYACDPPPSDSWWSWCRAYCYINIAGQYPASHPGNWKVKVSVRDGMGNWEYKFTQGFTIGVPDGRWSGIIHAPGQGYADDQVSFFVRAQNTDGSFSDSNQYHVYVLPECLVPGTPSNPSPSDRAKGVSVDDALDWSDCSNADSYDVYWGISSNPPFYTNVADSACSLPTMNYNTNYYWKIVAKNDCGNGTVGPEWNFATRLRGDLDHDGDIDRADHTIFRSTLGKCTGQTGFISEADYDGDGCVTYADYRIWYGYYRNQ